MCCAHGGFGKEFDNVEFSNGLQLRRYANRRGTTRSSKKRWLLINILFTVNARRVAKSNVKRAGIGPAIIPYRIRWFFIFFIDFKTTEVDQNTMSAVIFRTDRRWTRFPPNHTTSEPRSRGDKIFEFVHKRRS
jgi:hypothetical protein